MAILSFGPQNEYLLQVESRVNSLAASQSGGRVSSLVTPEDKLAMNVEDPLAVVAGNHFEGKFTDRPSETSLNYINLPRGRRIVPVDALSWVAAFNAGYEPRLDCTAVSSQNCFLGIHSLDFILHSLLLSKPKEKDNCF